MSWIPHFPFSLSHGAPLRALQARGGSAKMPSKYIFSGRNGLPILPKGSKLFPYFIKIWHYYFISPRIQPLLCHGFPQRFEFSSFANSLGDGKQWGAAVFAGYEIIDCQLTITFSKLLSLLVSKSTYFLLYLFSLSSWQSLIIGVRSFRRRVVSLTSCSPT